MFGFRQRVTLGLAQRFYCFRDLFLELSFGPSHLLSLFVLELNLLFSQGLLALNLLFEYCVFFFFDRLSLGDFEI